MSDGKECSGVTKDCLKIFSQIKSELGKVSSSIKSVENYVRVDQSELLNVKFANLERRIELTEKNLKDITRIDQHEKQILDCEKAIEELKKIVSKIPAQEQKIDNVEEDVDGMKEDLKETQKVIWKAIGAYSAVIIVITILSRVFF